MRLHHFDRAGWPQQCELDKLVRDGLATLPPGTVHSGTLRSPSSGWHTNIGRGAVAVE
jgi:hypothetical protein